jgi:hypothetical protein
MAGKEAKTTTFPQLVCMSPVFRMTKPLSKQSVQQQQTEAAGSFGRRKQHQTVPATAVYDYETGLPLIALLVRRNGNTNSNTNISLSKEARVVKQSFSPKCRPPSSSAFTD